MHNPAVIEFGLDGIAAVIASLHGLESDQETALKARLKHMQRMGFPQAQGVGKGQQAGYSLEDLFKVALAFQLIESGSPSFVASVIVQANWEICRGVLLDEVVLSAGISAQQKSGDNQKVIAIYLAETTQFGRTKRIGLGRRDEVVLISRHSRLSAAFRQVDERRVVVLIDPVILRRDVLALLEDAGASRELLEASLQVLRLQR